MALEVLAQLIEVVFADIVTCTEDFGAGGGKSVAEGLDNGFGTEVAAADAGYDDGVAVLAQGLGALVDLVDKLIGGVGGQCYPAEEVVAGACSVFKCLGGLGGAAIVFFYCALGQELCGFANV